MKIEIRNLKVAEFLSEETLAYSATIYVDGAKAFHASNQGHGGPDSYHELPGYAGPSEREISAWLAANLAPYTYEGGVIEQDLEMHVGGLIAAKQAAGKLARLLKTRVYVLADGKLATYSAKFKPTPANLEIIRARGERVVNGDESLMIEAARAYMGNG